MSFLKSVDAARARLQENALRRDNRDTATNTPETVAKSQESRGASLQTSKLVAASQVSQELPHAACDSDGAGRWRHDFEERAAVRQIEGGLSRPDAEGEALLDCAAQWRCEHPFAPSRPTDPCVHCGLPMKIEERTPVLAGGGHAWLHRRCWVPMDAARQTAALEAMMDLLGRLP